VALKHYNRAGALEASRRYAAYIDAAEDAAARTLGQAPGNLHKQKPARCLHDLTAGASDWRQSRSFGLS
jgi:hypothetical protein